MPAGSTNKLKISPDDIAQAASPTGRPRAASDPARFVILDASPHPKSSRRSLILLALVMTVVASAVLTLAMRKSSPATNWTEQIAMTADRSIVQIRARDGLGTGFVIASRNDRHLILTNRHVLAADANGFATGQVVGQCHVVLRNGETVLGKLVGLPRDPTLDLALLETSVRGLQPLGMIAPFADVRAGQRVVAVGHPHGLDFTITDGIVSAKRDGLLIQTSAAINPGNSGGPLIDEHLRVIGVNTLTIRPDLAHGLGFAIRADIALDTTAWDLSDSVLDLLRSTRR